MSSGKKKTNLSYKLLFNECFVQHLDEDMSFVTLLLGKLILEVEGNIEFTCYKNLYSSREETEVARVKSFT